MPAALKKYNTYIMDETTQTFLLCPYVIELAINNGAYTDQANIFNEYDSIKQCKLHKTFIDRIVSFMTEFLNDHGITVTSYDDFCHKYSNENGKLSDAPLFMMHYFINGAWKTWEPKLYDNEIYTAYILTKLI